MSTRWGQETLLWHEAVIVQCCEIFFKTRKQVRTVDCFKDINVLCFNHLCFFWGTQIKNMVLQQFKANALKLHLIHNPRVASLPFTNKASSIQ